MRSTDFFIGKAKEYITSIDKILAVLLSSALPGTFTKYNEQPEKISDIRVKIRALFSEFENGGLFEKNIVAIDDNNMLRLDDEEILERYRHILSLFIDHLPLLTAETAGYAHSHA